MHDSSEDPAIRANKQSAEAAQLLVKALKRCGYRFARLDEIPQAQSAVQVSTLITLRSPAGHFLTRAQDDLHQCA